MNTHPLLDLPGRSKPYVMAHRGNKVTHPENTLAAFRQALLDGADILETDLHLTADGAFVCIHDETVNRTTDGNGLVAEMTLSEIKSLSASYGQDEFKSERIPTLSELIALIPADVALALELKTDRFLEESICRQLVAELGHSGIRSRIIVLSFSLPRLQTVQTIAPDIPIGWITLSNRWPLKGPKLLGPCWKFILSNPLYVLVAHWQGQVVCPLDPTPDSRLWLYRLLGCDAVLTDNPGVTCTALKKSV